MEGIDPIGSVVFVENLTIIATYLPSCVGTDPIGGVAAQRLYVDGGAEGMI